jgi:SWI/SNF-related matrix-associated actin-dependent regulator 1 of chromatin subfamily A
MEPSLNRRIKESMLTTPMPFQWEVIRFMEEINLRGFNFSSMGVGKTYTTLGNLALHPELRPAFIVCPASLKVNWRREALMHIGESTVILSGEKPTPLTGPWIYVINYDIVSKWLHTILATKPKLLVFDEVQALKNLRAKRTKACKQLAMHTPHVIGLSGTPIANRPQELFSILNIVTPHIHPSWNKYAARYCNAKRKPWGMDYSGASNLKELHNTIKPYFIRIKKEDVLKDLPPKQRIILPVELSNRSSYRKAEENFLRWLEDIKPEKMETALRAEALVKLAELRTLVVAGKMSAISEWVDNYLETDKKLIVFMCHTDPLHQIYNEHKKHAVLIDGSVSMGKRDAAVQSFQHDPKCRLFCGNIVAAGTGLTLTAADTTLFGELSYVPSDHAQAEDRNYRIGTTSSSVQCYYAIAENTLEEKVCDMLHKKMKIIDQVLEGKEGDSAGWAFKTELFLAMKKKTV